MMGISEDEASITLNSGDTVTWTWGDEIPHIVKTIDAEAPEDFGSEILTGEGNVYSYTFTDPAAIDYRCIVHTTMMRGVITVEPNMSLDEQFLKNLRIYPTILIDRLHINSLFELDSYELFNSEGKIVLNGNLQNQNKISIEVSHLPIGVYFMRLKSSKGPESSIRLIKK